MQNTNFWHKLDLRWQKVTALLAVVLILGGFSANAQTNNQNWNLPDYDEKLLHYGFQIGVHTSGYRVDYSNDFKDIGDSDNRYNNLKAIMRPNMPGFSLGFILNLHLQDQLDLRLLPKVGFYEYSLDYVYTDGSAEGGDPTIISQTNVDLPLMVKYKSQRRGNSRMYLIAGITPSFRASHKGQDDIDDSEKFLTKTGDLKLEVGVGMDQYFPLFKFAPELRYAYGIRDVMDYHTNYYHDAIDNLNTHSLTLYLNFE